MRDEPQASGQDFSAVSGWNLLDLVRSTVSNAPERGTTDGVSSTSNIEQFSPEADEVSDFDEPSNQASLEADEDDEKTDETKPLSSLPSESPKQLTHKERDEIAKQRTSWTDDQFKKYVIEMTPQDRWIATMVFQGKFESSSLPELQVLAKDHDDLREYLAGKPRMLDKLGLTSQPGLEAEVGIQPLRNYKKFFSFLNKLDMSDVHLFGQFEDSYLKTLFKLAQTDLASLPRLEIRELMMDLYLEDGRPAFIKDLASFTEGQQKQVQAYLNMRSLCIGMPKDLAVEYGQKSDLEVMAATVAWHKTESLKNDASGMESNEETTNAFRSSFTALQTAGKDEIVRQYQEYLNTFDVGRSPRLYVSLFVKVAAPGLTQQQGSDLNAGLQDWVSQASSMLNWRDAARVEFNDILRGINPEVMDEALRLNKNNRGLAVRLALIFPNVEQLQQAHKQLGSERLATCLSQMPMATRDQMKGLSDRLLEECPPKESSQPVGTTVQNNPRLFPFSQPIERDQMVSMFKNWTALTDKQKSLPTAQLKEITYEAMQVDILERTSVYPHRTLEQWKTTFSAIEQADGLNSSDKNALIAAFFANPEIQTTLKKETLPDAVKGWNANPKFSQEIAEKVGAMPLWHQVAASVAWNDTAPLRSASGGDGIRAFWSRFEELKNGSRQTVFLQDGDPTWAAKSMFSSFSDAECKRLGRICRTEALQLGNPVELLIQLQAGAYRDALRFLENSSSASVISRGNAVLPVVPGLVGPPAGEQGVGGLGAIRFRAGAAGPPVVEQVVLGPGEVPEVVLEQVDVNLVREPIGINHAPAIPVLLEGGVNGELILAPRLERVQQIGWEGRSALALSLTFGKEWQRWIEIQTKRGISSHDATYWLPLQSTNQLKGLKEFLFKNCHQNLSDLEVVATRWHELTPEQRQGNFDTVLKVSKTAGYLNVRNQEFAIECAQWGISSGAYPKLEQRYQVSLDTPSPFPVEKRWTSGKLVGYFLKRDDPRGLFLGKHTHCCQEPHGNAAKGAWHGQESANGGFFVVEDMSKGQIVAGSWAWVTPEGGVCFDSIEGGFHGRESDVLNLYKAASSELVREKYSIVTVTKAARFENFGLESEKLPLAGSSSLSSPPGGYTRDVQENEQVVLAKGVPVPGADNRPENWVRARTGGGLEIILENRKDGRIGSAKIDESSREIREFTVARSDARETKLLLNAVLKRAEIVGGRWSISSADPHVKALLRSIEHEGTIKIIDVTATNESDRQNETFSFEVSSPTGADSITTDGRARAESVVPGSESRVTPEQLRRDEQQLRRAQVELERDREALREQEARRAAENANFAACPETVRDYLNAQIAGELQEDPGSKSIGELEPKQFRDLLEVALTKARASLNLSEADLKWTEAVQTALRDGADEAKFTVLHKELTAIARAKNANGPAAAQAEPGANLLPARPAAQPAAGNVTLPDFFTQADPRTIIDHNNRPNGEQKPKINPDEANLRRQAYKQALKRYAYNGAGFVGGLLGIASGALELFGPSQEEER